MAIYLIDTENVQTKFVQLIDRLNNEDTIMLFMNKDKHNMSLHIDDVLNINSKNVTIEIVDCCSGKAKKNSLDFQLVSYLGYIISKQGNQRYVIVSNDSGFDPVVEFWRTFLNIDIERIAINATE